MAPKPVIGLLGGGQLGRMLCEAAGPLGIEIAVLDEANCPAVQAANKNGLHVAGSFKDPERIRELARKADVLTVEIEHVDTEVLEEIATRGVEVETEGADGKVVKTTKRVPVHPSWRTLRLVQDKYLQKEHFRENGLPIAEQMAIADGEAQLDSLREAGAKFGYPFMLKARKGSYDGRGNVKVSSAADVERAAKELPGLPLYAEKWCEFVQELAVMVVRTEDDDGSKSALFPYPVVETVHEDSICTKTFMPPRGVSAPICRQAEAVAVKVISTFWGRGVFAVEMFLLKDGSILVNEVAPRPHNSGHYTIEAVPYMSQYKAQLYAILNKFSIRQLQPRVGTAIMLNILGGATADAHELLVQRAEECTSTSSMDVYVHLYGKASKSSRKIGHITFTGVGSSTITDLEQEISSYITLVNQMRADRLEAATQSLRPQQQASTAAASSTAAQQQQPAGRAQVLVTMGSDSDLPVLKAGLDILEEFGVPYEVDITSAHRTPTYMAEVAARAAGRGLKVIIAAAGGAAHLPGMAASHTPLPVIGVPVKATHLDGVDSLHSIVQMPRGVPVATVGINNSTNAALLAIRILGSFYPEYQEKMSKYQLGMEEGVHAKGEKLRSIGYMAYLQGMGK